MKTPTFGKREETLTYQTRYAAYIIVSKPENNTMVLVQAPNGAYFLPGGEIGRYLGEADEYFYSNHRQTAYYNPGYFYVANTWRQLSEPLERTNTLHWVAPEEAVRLLKRGSHRWAVEKWLAAAS